VIGVYEPAFVCAPDGSGRESSLLTLGHELLLAGSIVLHRDCHSAYEQAAQADQDPS
jgi:hypothetical protein